jgi:uncharacterized protein (DUF302 family)
MIVYQVESKKSLPEVAKGFETACQNHKFGVLGIHDLKAKLKEKGVEFDRDCLVYEICNPQQAKKVLEANPQISTALPCRVSIFPKGTSITLATIRPTALLALFENQELKPVAQEVEEVILKIMDEAAR